MDPDLRQVHARRFDWLTARVHGRAVLELGPADGVTTIALAERDIAVTAVDPDPAALAHIAARLTTRAAPVADRVTLVESPAMDFPSGVWPSVLILSAAERSPALPPLLSQAAGAVEAEGRLLLSLRLGVDDAGLPWASTARLAGIRDARLPLELREHEVLRTADGSCSVWVSEWRPAPMSDEFVDCFHAVAHQALAHATSGAHSLRQVSVRLADRAAASSRELQVLRRSLSTVDDRIQDVDGRHRQREQLLVRERDDERRLRLELAAELDKRVPRESAGAASGPLPPQLSLPRLRGSGLRVVAAAAGLNGWLSDWVIPVTVAESRQAPDQVDVVLVDTSSQAQAGEQRELVGMLRPTGARVIDVRRSPGRPLWAPEADAVVDPSAQSALTAAHPLVEPLDVRRINPRGFAYTSQDVVGVLTTTAVVPATLRRLAARIPGAPDLVVRPVQRWDGVPQDLRAWRAALDHADLHEGPEAHASAVVRLAAAGVPVIALDLPVAVRALIGAQLAAALDLVPLTILVDDDARERASIALRRAALLAHSAEARWRALAAAVGLRVPRPPAVSILLATNRPDYLDHAIAQASRQDHGECELVVALHGDRFDVDTERRIADNYAGAAVVLRIAGIETLGDALNAAADAASGELLTKFDDDDWYGSEHVSDLALAHAYSGGTLVAKGAEFVYLAELDVTLRRFTTGGESTSRTIAGGTILIAKHDLSAVGGWRRARRSVDQLLVDDVLAAGGQIYRTHGHGYVLNRHGQGHTWNPAVDYFLEQSTRQWRGLAQAAASIL